MTPTFGSEPLEDLDGGASALLVQHRHHRIGGVGHDGAKHASCTQRGKKSRDSTVPNLRRESECFPPRLTDVTSHEGDHQLLGFAALAAGLGNDILVEHFHRALKAGKFHHGVRDLPHPQRYHALVESRSDIGGKDTRDVTAILFSNIKRLKMSVPLARNTGRSPVQKKNGGCRRCG